MHDCDVMVLAVELYAFTVVFPPVVILYSFTMSCVYRKAVRTQGHIVPRYIPLMVVPVNRQIPLVVLVYYAP